MQFNPITSDLIDELRSILGSSAVSTAKADLDLHARDQSHHAAHAAEVVIFPSTADGVSRVMKLANMHHVPVTPWGVGTGLEGNSIPVFGGILMSFERMNKIVAVHADDFQVTVQPGIGHKDLNADLARYGGITGGIERHGENHDHQQCKEEHAVDGVARTPLQAKVFREVGPDVARVIHRLPS